MARDGDLRAIFRRNLPKFDWTSVESGGTGRGIPDSNYCLDGREGWCEFKQTKAWAVGLRPEQVGWILRRVRHGGRVWIAVRRMREDSDELWIAPGNLAGELKAEGLNGLVANTLIRLRWFGGPAKWNWDQIAKVLVS
jgi:hypothetical protein